MAESLIVTSALPYANGPIHFGHVVGAYLPADIYVRFRRALGDDVHFVCGTDEHGVAITLKAEQAGQSYEEYVDHWHREILSVLTSVGIEFDAFTGTAHHRNPEHRELAQQFFTDLLDNGYVFERTEEQFYSPTLERFLPDRYIEGTCYVCGYEQARGDECPNCGTWLDAKRLGNPRCTLDDSSPELRPSRHWYLDLPKIREEWLGEWFQQKRSEWKPNVLRFVEAALKDLRERPITRDLPWGVPVPLPDTEGKVLYVWFDAPIGYLSISKQHFAAIGQPERFEQLWKSGDTELYHFIGKDNITFHVVVFPSMLHGTKAGWITPHNVPANEFFNLEGRKFNTSAGWYIPADSIAQQQPTDALRYALTTMMPETADSDWSWREFQARINDDLADNIGNFASRVLRFVERFFDGKLPGSGALEPQDEAVLAAGITARSEIEEHFRRFEFRRGCQRLMIYGNECNRYFDHEQPWSTRKTDEPRCATTLRVCAELIRSIAVLAQPVLPETSRKLLDALGIEGLPAWSTAGGVALPPEPTPVRSVVLFPKIEEAAIEAELTRLTEMQQPEEQPAEEAAAAPDHEPIAEAIEFDTFAAVDLRAGTVLEAEKHPKADRLLVLKIDLGFEQRTIVAGVAASYPEPAALVGKRVSVVANLAPRKLRGIESQGMLLAADDADGKPRFVSPDSDSPNGTRIG